MQNALVNTNKPANRAYKAIVSKDISVDIKNSLQDYEIELVLMEANSFLPSPLACHVDMQLVNINDGVFVYAPGISEKILKFLQKFGFDLIQGSITTKGYYPFDIAYNCAIVGKNAFLNPRYTDPLLLDLIKRFGINIYPVKQGYAKCSTCTVSEEAIITADIHIYRKAIEAGLDVLIIPPQTKIILPGYDYGFIGGASGVISDDELAFFGDIKFLPDADTIMKFCKKHGKKILSLSKANIVDVGGLFPLSPV